MFFLHSLLWTRMHLSQTFHASIISGQGQHFPGKNSVTVRSSFHRNTQETFPSLGMRRTKRWPNQQNHRPFFAGSSFLLTEALWTWTRVDQLSNAFDYKQTRTHTRIALLNISQHSSWRPGPKTDKGWPKDAAAERSVDSSFISQKNAVKNLTKVYQFFFSSEMKNFWQRRLKTTTTTTYYILKVCFSGVHKRKKLALLRPPVP